MVQTTHMHAVGDQLSLLSCYYTELRCCVPCIELVLDDAGVGCGQWHNDYLLVGSGRSPVKVQGILNASRDRKLPLNSICCVFFLRCWASRISMPPNNVVLVLYLIKKFWKKITHTSVCVCLYKVSARQCSQTSLTRDIVAYVKR